MVPVLVDRMVRANAGLWVTIEKNSLKMNGLLSVIMDSLSVGTISIHFRNSPEIVWSL